MAAPLISVLLPARNAGAFIDQALASVLTQSYRDFEVVAVDDGSTDDTAARLGEWARRDARLTVVSQSGIGPAAALNCAIVRARGELLARMDADDLSLPMRFAEQVALMRARREVGVCGTWARTFGTAGRHIWRYPAEDAGIRARLLFDSPFAHPSVMIRRQHLDRLPIAYRTEVGRAEDYDLWARIAKVCEFANVPRVLLRYRTHPAQVTTTEGTSSRTGAEQVRSMLLLEWWPDCPANDRQFHHRLCSGDLPVELVHLHCAEQWLLKLAAHHQRAPIVSHAVWRATLAVKWWEVCRDFRSLGSKMLMRYVRSPLHQPRAIPPHRWIRLMAEAIMAVAKNGGVP